MLDVQEESSALAKTVAVVTALALAGIALTASALLAMASVSAHGRLIELEESVAKVADDQFTLEAHALQVNMTLGRLLKVVALLVDDKNARLFGGDTALPAGGALLRFNGCGDGTEWIRLYLGSDSGGSSYVVQRYLDGPEVRSEIDWAMVGSRLTFRIVPTDYHLYVDDGRIYKAKLIGDRLVGGCQAVQIY